MPQCTAIKANGERCKVAAMPGKPTCWGHDPENSERRKQIARQGNRAGGKGRPSAARDELREIKKLLRALFGKVYKSETATGTAYALNSLLNTQLRCIEVEKKLIDQEALEERIAALEQAAPPQGRSPTWRT